MFVTLLYAFSPFFVTWVYNFTIIKILYFSDKLVRLFNVIEENNNIEETTWSPLEGHTYAINHVEFSKDGTMLASCSLDGCTSLWNPKVKTIFLCELNKYV